MGVKVTELNYGERFHYAGTDYTFLHYRTLSDGISVFVRRDHSPVVKVLVLSRSLVVRLS